jgi:hypothetical protein
MNNNSTAHLFGWKIFARMFILVCLVAFVMFYNNLKKEWNITLLITAYTLILAFVATFYTILTSSLDRIGILLVAILITLVPLMPTASASNNINDEMCADLNKLFVNKDEIGLNNFFTKYNIALDAALLLITNENVPEEKVQGGCWHYLHGIITMDMEKSVRKVRVVKELLRDKITNQITSIKLIIE